jgi:hypothetical protein
VVALILLAILVSALVLLKEERPAVQGVSSLHQMLSQTGALPHSPLTWGPVIIWAGAYVTSLSLLGVWGQSLLMQGHGFTHTSASMLMFAFMTSFSGGSLAIAQWRPVLDARLADLRKRFFAGSSGRELAARDIDGGTSQESRRRQGEKGREIRHLFGRPGAADRNATEGRKCARKASVGKRRSGPRAAPANMASAATAAVARPSQTHTIPRDPGDGISAVTRMARSFVASGGSVFCKRFKT